MNRFRFVGLACLAAMSPACTESNDVPVPLGLRPLFPAQPGGVAVERTEPDAVDLSAQAAQEQFRYAVHEFERLTQTTGRPFERIKGGISFLVPHESAEEQLTPWNRDIRAMGAIMFRHENSFNMGSRKDVLVLVPTLDKFLILQAVLKKRANQEKSNDEVLAWLRGLDKSHPWVLTGAGSDFVEGYFVKPPEEATELAEKMYEFCPGIVDQGFGSVPRLAEEVAKGKIFLWWD